jgi:hypothetical protein
MFSIHLFMDAERRARFVKYFAGRPLMGDRAKLMAKTGYTKGRVAQLFDEKQPFGQKAARNLADKLGLPPDYFERGDQARAAAGADLTDQEHEMLAAFRLVSDAARAELLAKAIQMALDAQPAIARMMEMAGVSRRADDSDVLSWWHRAQERTPRVINEGPSGTEGGLLGGKSDIEQQKADQ